MNRQKVAMVKCLVILAIVVVIMVAGTAMDSTLLDADFSQKKLAPSLAHLFGTDWLGRDIFYRTIKGLTSSITIGIVASVFSAVLAVVVGIVSATSPKWVDEACAFIIDLIMSIPHLVLLILISFCVGRGTWGVMLGLVLTHWTSLARVIRGEVLALREEPYIQMSHKLGKSKLFIAKNHIFPHILPQFVVGVVVMFPHAILHEAAITFLGFGLSPEAPAIGIILSETMGYLTSNMWWIFIPGVCLVALILLFDQLAENLRSIL